jgi:hypothetical protein
MNTKTIFLAAAATSVLFFYTAFPAANAQQLDNTQPDQAPDQNTATAVQGIAAPISDTDGDPASSFQTDLAPYGTWMNLNGQMYWQPNDAGFGSNWRPYADGGHWVLTDAGWTWDSKYDWGWAPFHYGRWVDDPVLGWLWVPGWMWGPAWVAWRDNDTICGWAPLPPGSEYDVGFGFRFHGTLVSADFDFGLGPDDYCFISISDMCQPSYQTYRVPAQRAAEVYKQTTTVKTAYSVQSGQVINAGIAVDRVRAATHREIVPLKIAQAESSREKSTTANTLKLYRPNLQLKQAIGDLLPPALSTHNPPPAHPGGASDAMDEILLPAKTGHVVTQEPGGVLDRILAGGHSPPGVNPEPPGVQSEPAHGKTDAVDALLNRGHAPTPGIRPMSGATGQTGYGPGTSAPQRGYAGYPTPPARGAGPETAPLHGAGPTPPARAAGTGTPPPRGPAPEQPRRVEPPPQPPPHAQPPPEPPRRVEPPAQPAQPKVPEPTTKPTKPN